MNLSAGERASAVRRSSGWFRLRERALLEVSGGDRVRWLNGMLSNDVAQLESGGASSGCYALLLTPRGRIVADLHVLQRGDVFWLELAADAAARVEARLEKYIIADDVWLVDRSRAFARFGLEGSALGAAGRKRMRRVFSLERQTETVIRIYERLTANAGTEGEPL